VSDAVPDYTTEISRVSPGAVVYRGYRVEDVIAHASGSEAVFLILAGRRPSAVELRIFDAVIGCCAEHGFVNTAAVASRYVMSGSASLPGALAAGLLAFGQNTGTSHLTAEMLRDLAGGDARGVSDKAISSYVADLRRRRLAVPGLGHPLHRVVDPRERALRSVIDACGFGSDYVMLLDRLHRRANEVIGRYLVLNVDGLIGAVLLAMAFGPSEILAVNIIGAMPGIAAHAIEEHRQGRKLRLPPDRDVAYLGSAEPKEWKRMSAE
jgi:citrate synthase